MSTKRKDKAYQQNITANTKDKRIPFYYITKTN